METVAITGNTFPVKDLLKGLGARWDVDMKVWRIDVTKEAEARLIVANPPAATTATATTANKRTFVHHKCQICGARATARSAIYRSGECRDCYEERKQGY